MCRKRRRCRNGCGEAVAVPGYCAGCKALRILLSRIHGGDDHRDGNGRRTEAEEVESRLELYRRRAAGIHGRAW